MIQLLHVTKTFHQGKTTEVKALSDVSLEIRAGEMVAVTGPSGSGKSTLLQMIGLMDTPDSGSYRLNGEEILAQKDSGRAKIRNQFIRMIMQDYGIIPRMNVMDNVMLPLIIRGRFSADIRKRASELLDKVGLHGKEHMKAGFLSGGEQQRVAAARALLSGAELILADEPTGALDSENKHAVMKLLKQINQQGKTVIVATHDVLAASYCGRMIRLEDGQIKEDKISAE